MVMSDQPALYMAPSVEVDDSSPQDLSYVMSSYFGLKQLLVTHCLRNLDYVNAVQDDPQLFASFCKTVVTRDDEPAFDDVRKRYDQLVSDMYAFMTNIPKGKKLELSKAPKISVLHNSEDTVIEFGESRENLSTLISDKQYSDSIVLLAYFLLEKEDAEISQKEPDNYLIDEMVNQRAQLLSVIQSYKEVKGKKNSKH